MISKKEKHASFHRSKFKQKQNKTQLNHDDEVDILDVYLSIALQTHSRRHLDQIGDLSVETEESYFGILL